MKKGKFSWGNVELIEWRRTEKEETERKRERGAVTRRYCNLCDLATIQSQGEVTI